MQLVNPAKRNFHRNTLTNISGLSFDEQLKKAGLDWKVELSRLQYGRNGEFIEPGKVSVAYRADNGHFIDVYRNRRPWQNEEILGRFWEFCTGADLEIEHLGYLRGQVVAMAKLPDSDMTDPTENRIVLHDSHSNGKGLRIALFRNRIVCTNAWRSAIEGSTRTVKHVGEFKPDVISATLQSAINTIDTIDQREKRLATTPLTDDRAMTMLIAAFGDPSKGIQEQPPVVQDVMNLYKGDATGSELGTMFNTAYGLLQSVTEYYNWQTKGCSNAAGFASVLAGTRNQKMNQFTNQMVSVYCPNL